MFIRHHRTLTDPCVYFKQLDQKRGMVTVFVDDNTLIAETDEGKATLKQMIGSKFRLHDLGPLHHLLGIRFNESADGSLLLDEEAYVTKVLERFGMNDCRPIDAPMEVSLKLDKAMCPFSRGRLGQSKKPTLQRVHLCTWRRVRGPILPTQLRS